MWCWRRLLRVPWTARRSHQSILKRISPGCSLEGLMLKLKLQYSATWYEELTHLKTPWCWEGLKARGKGDNRGWDGWVASPTQWIWVWVNSGSWWWTRRPGMLQSTGSQRVGHNWATEQQAGLMRSLWTRGPCLPKPSSLLPPWAWLPGQPCPHSPTSISVQSGLTAETVLLLMRNSHCTVLWVVWSFCACQKIPCTRVCGPWAKLVGSDRHQLWPPVLCALPVGVCHWPKSPFKDVISCSWY